MCSVGHNEQSDVKKPVICRLSTVATYNNLTVQHLPYFLMTSQIRKENVSFVKWSEKFQSEFFFFKVS